MSELITALQPLPSPARTREPERGVVRVGLVQERWREDPDEHRAALARGVAAAAGEGARLVCLQELTLHRYFAADADPDAARDLMEDIPDGPTSRFASELAREHGTWVAASLYERGGYNTAICAAPDGTIALRTRKLHIPCTEGYREDLYFTGGPPGADAFGVVEVDGTRVGVPTCFDQWFPELARAYALNGADLVAYPTAIGSEPDHPQFDTQPLWRHMIVSHAIANGMFVAAVNRVGSEGALTFYGSSLICDPYGRVLVEAPRDRTAVLVAALDLDQRRDWLELFPLLRVRRPDAYGPLDEGGVRS